MQVRKKEAKFFVQVEDTSYKLKRQDNNDEALSYSTFYRNLITDNIIKIVLRWPFYNSSQNATAFAHELFVFCAKKEVQG